MRRARSRFRERVSPPCQHRPHARSSPLRFFNPAPLADAPISRRGEPRLVSRSSGSRRERVTSSARASGPPARSSTRSPTPAEPDRRFAGGSRQRGIDPKLARLVLLFYGRSSLRVADVAWALGVSPSTASRWLDRAERDGPRRQAVRLASIGAAPGRVSPTRASISATGSSGALDDACRTNERPRGVAWGIRAHAGVGTT